MQETQKWRQTILGFESRKIYGNPFLDVKITAEFIGPSGKRILRQAYWDGGRSYKIAFAPTETGVWNYTLKAPKDTGLDGISGKVNCVEYTGELMIYRHGFLKVHPSGRYFTYDDGTPFFWLGDTHWEFAYRERWAQSNHRELKSMFCGMAERRVKQGFNVYQTNLRSDVMMGGDALYWDQTCSTDLPNVTFYQEELDRRMYFLADLGLVNALGQAWCVSIHDGIEKQKHLAEYLIARYGALPIVWTLAGEVAGYSSGEDRRVKIDGWREVARFISETDGYGHLQTAHYTNERPFAEYYQDEPWMDFTLNQAGHGDYPISAAHYRDFLKCHGDKPFVEGEALYEYCSTFEEMGIRMCTADMLRRVAYMSVQLGGCGYTYGAQGIWDCLWEKDDPNPMKLFNRFQIPWYVAVDGPGADQMGYMKEFYEKVRFWEMKPYQDTEGEEENLFGNKQPFISISTDAGRLVLYYSDGTRKRRRIEGLLEQTYSMTWFDPRTGSYQEGAEEFVPESGVWNTPEKPGEGDWLLIVETVEKNEEDKKR